MIGETYTRDGLVTEAAHAGHEVTPRLVSDWIAIGLLDRGVDRGRGRARGKEYRWPDAQRRLFLLLLDKRAQVSRPTLTNVPVAMWLIWGDELVPLRQVRRAMKTWVAKYAAVGAGRAAEAADGVVTQLDHPKASSRDRAALHRAIETAAYGGKFNPDTVRDLARRVFDPSGTGLTRGPFGVLGSEHYVETVVARLTAIQQLDSIAEATYRAARSDYLTFAQASKLTDLSPQQIARTGTEPSWEDAVNGACLDLLTLLGLKLVEAATPPKVT